ncbi:MAG: hypothetical protein J6D03_09960 [Clostridia bacterium]|nr:hypothetical protein [Clostridia bacterium]
MKPFLKVDVDQYDNWKTDYDANTDKYKNQLIFAIQRDLETEPSSEYMNHCCYIIFNGFMWPSNFIKSNEKNPNYNPIYGEGSDSEL